jgi:hypothetical protein
VGSAITKPLSFIRAAAGHKHAQHFEILFSYKIFMRPAPIGQENNPHRHARPALLNNRSTESQGFVILTRGRGEAAGVNARAIRRLCE